MMSGQKRATPSAHFMPPGDKVHSLSDGISQTGMAEKMGHSDGYIFAMFCGDQNNKFHAYNNLLKR